MIFLSTLLRQSVYDLEGRRLGGIRDICVTLQETFPVVTALIVHTPLGNSHSDLIIPWFQVYSLEEPQIHLVVKQSQIEEYTPQPDELLLRRDILDKHGSGIPGSKPVCGARDDRRQPRGQRNAADSY